jgi:hypothetical protein
MARVAGVQDLRGAAEQLEQEPVFCVETAVRLFYWARLAYRKDKQLDYEYINAATALRLFDLQHTTTVWDDATDTHVVLGWSGSAAVLAFRGTASLQVGGQGLAWQQQLRRPSAPKAVHSSSSPQPRLPV